MTTFFLKPGDKVTFAKTVGESDIYLFAGVTGDLSPNHVNEEFMKKTAFGARIAHGVLIVGYMSTASTLMIDKFAPPDRGHTPVSLGYDRIRFLKPVFIGDTVTVNYQIDRIDPDRMRSYSAIEVVNQSGDLVAIATHVMKWVKDT